MYTHVETDPGYLVRLLAPGRYEVTKWGFDNEPLAVYRVNEPRLKTFRCNGPSRQCHAGKCKHVDLVRWTKKNPNRDPYVMLCICAGD